MKHIFLFLLITLITSCNSNKKRALIGKSEFQKKLNTEFKDASKSPLTKNDLKKFKELDFYPINEKYKVKAKLIKTPDAPIFKFPTTTDRIAVYKKYGEVYFTIDNKDLKLDIYTDEQTKEPHENDLFLPFLDKTSGKNSYGGGRFIDVSTKDLLENETIIINFNQAYNPYCAYSDKYSCPITPRNNFIDIAIEAGVMAYKKQ